MTSARRTALLAKGGATHTERQMAVTVGTMPTAACLEVRRVDADRMRANLLQTPLVPGGADLTDIVVLGSVTSASAQVSLGDALWQVHRPSGRARDSDPNLNLVGADLVEVFSSFAGLAGKLPPGYAMRVRKHPTTAGTVGAWRSFGAMVRIGAGGVHTDLDPQADAEEIDEVLRVAFAGVTRNLRFVGVALGSYRVGGNAPGGGEGVAAMVGGRVSLENTSSDTLLPGMYVTWVLPCTGDLLMGNPMVVGADPRARMAIYDAEQHMRTSLKDSFHSLLGARMNDSMYPSPFVRWSYAGMTIDPLKQNEGLFKVPALAIHMGLGVDAMTREEKAAPSGSKDALVLVHLVEAALRLGVHIGREATDKAGDVVVVNPGTAPNDEVNYVRVLLGELMEVEQYMGNEGPALPDGINDTVLEYTDAKKNLKTALAAFVAALPRMAVPKHGRGPFAKVLRAADPTFPVDVLLL